MDEIGRLASDVSQLTKRVDDLSMRLAVNEIKVTNFDEKLDRIEKSLDKLNERWGKYGFWLITLVFGAMLLAFIRFAMEGGLAPPVKALGF